MKRIKKAFIWFLVFVMALSVVPNTSFANENVDFYLQYSVDSQISEDKAKGRIVIDFAEDELLDIESVTLPDGNVKEGDMSSVNYDVLKNGKYDFIVEYAVNDTVNEEKISVDIDELNVKSEVINENIHEQKESKKISSKQILTKTRATMDNQYTVSNADELRDAVDKIKNSQSDKATIILNADITGERFAGVLGKTITVKSVSDKKYIITIGNYLEGDVTFDNVYIKGGSLYCNGHKTIFTKNSVFSIGSLFGGAYEKDVDSVYVKINGKGTINSGSSELVIVGGCYKGSVNGSIYMEVDGDIKINSTQGGHYITGGSKETRYGGDTYTGEPLYVNGDIDFILGLNDASVGHNVSGTHNTHVYGDLNMNIKSGKYIGIDGQREEPKKAIVDGNINMLIG